MRWFSNRKYKSGTGWCIWRWTQVDSEYIVRLHILKTPWFAVCLHWILKPDPEPYLHDHPVTFLSIILRGWYSELRTTWGSRIAGMRYRCWFNWIRASRTDRHSICDVAEGGALTLCLMSPKTQEWGFHGVQLLDGKLIPRRGSWLHWKDYYAAQRAEKEAQS